MNNRIIAAVVASAALAFSPIHTLSADDHEVDEPVIDLGNDNGEFAMDGQCDDVRFIGAGMSAVLLTDSIGKDASDCMAAFHEGTVSPSPMHLPPVDDASIIFGDDSSAFANDGECDDIRFVGSHSNKAVYIVDDIGGDASDCRAGFEAGLLKWQGSSATPVYGITADDILESIREDAPLV